MYRPLVLSQDDGSPLFNHYRAQTNHNNTFIGNEDEDGQEDPTPKVKDEEHLRTEDEVSDIRANN